MHYGLKTSIERGLTSLHIIGDSKLIVEKENGNYKLENLLPIPIMDRIK
jgi:hypothetical protein